MKEPKELKNGDTFKVDGQEYRVVDGKPMQVISPADAIEELRDEMDELRETVDELRKKVDAKPLVIYPEPWIPWRDTAPWQPHWTVATTTVPDTTATGMSEITFSVGNEKDAERFAGLRSTDTGGPSET